MFKIRVVPGQPWRAAVGVLAGVWLAGVTPAPAQVVHTFDQARSTKARANDAQRDNAVVGFGTWSSDLHVDAPNGANATDGTATQTSGIYGDSTLARGAAAARALGTNDTADGNSNFRVSFLVETRTGFTLSGRVTTRAATAVGGEAEANAMILFSGPGGMLAATQRDCGVHAAQPEPCDKSDDLVASGVLDPGIYVLEAHASAAGKGGTEAAGEAAASFTLGIWFDGPIVSTRPVTWSDYKSLYR